MSRRLPRVAIVGRQNVGKSTLVNRMFGGRESIAHETPGVTRDRVEVEVEWLGRRFSVMDTGGYVERAGGIEALVAEQAARAAEDADLVLLVVDGQTGPQEEDALLARRLRRATVPVLLVVNKADSDALELEAPVFHSLGLGEPIAVSALHGRAAGELLDHVIDLLPEQPASEGEAPEPRFALVGRPKVGKSSLFNRLVGGERAVVYPEAGTTRDAVDEIVEWDGKAVRFVDTAGLRRRGRMQGLDYYGLVRALRALDRADVALLVLDATDGLTADDKHVASRVIESGRGLAIAANKWDLVPPEDRDPLFKELGEIVGPFARPHLVRTSAVSGVGVGRLPNLLLRTHERWSTRVATAEANKVLQEAQDRRPPRRGTARYRYGTQVSAGPPSFVLFGGPPPDPGYKRFLENRLREAFGFEGVPIRLSFRARGRRSGSGSRK